jgi:hypothetical protein
LILPVNAKLVVTGEFINIGSGLLKPVTFMAF